MKMRLNTANSFDIIGTDIIEYCILMEPWEVKARRILAYRFTYYTGQVTGKSIRKILLSMSTQVNTLLHTSELTRRSNVPWQLYVMNF